MKGPGIRIDLDVRRLWRCPRCGDERKATGTVTARVCSRAECAGVWMRLVEPLRKPVLRYVAPPHVPIPDEPENPARAGTENGGRPSRRQRRDGQGQTAEAAVTATPTEVDAASASPSEADAPVATAAPVQPDVIVAPGEPAAPTSEFGTKEDTTVAEPLTSSPDVATPDDTSAETASTGTTESSPDAPAGS